MTSGDPYRLIEVTLDDRSIGRAPPDVEHERAVAIYDLIDENSFHPEGAEPGPYRLQLSLADNRLVFNISSENSELLVAHILSLTPFRKIVKDYFLICESYYQAIKTSSPSRIEAIDMGRRGVHNDGSQLLLERLKGKIGLDFDTARRLFTLVCVLHWRG
ncbi:MAG TPA: UPF0262 family protein [Afifellaceae bacterium]|nr:UPF0262 family protein [Afifellaceae bacterium]